MNYKNGYSKITVKSYFNEVQRIEESVNMLRECIKKINNILEINKNDLSIELNQSLINDKFAPII